MTSIIGNLIDTQLVQLFCLGTVDILQLEQGFALLCQEFGNARGHGKMDGLSTQDNGTSNPRGAGKIRDPISWEQPDLVTQEAAVGTFDVFNLENKKTKLLASRLSKSRMQTSLTVKAKGRAC